MEQRPARASVFALGRHALAVLVRLLIQSGLALLATAGAVAAQCPGPSAEVIGPGTPCQACWQNPTTSTDGSPLLELLTVAHFYLDPLLAPTGPPLTPPAFAVPLDNGAAGATNSAAICARITPPTGAHTLSVSVSTTTVESGGSSPPLPFYFQGIPAGPGSGVRFR